MQNIGDKVDNTPGASGELTAAEYNDHKNEIQKPVTSTAQALSGLKTPNQLSRASFIYGSAAQTMVDAAPSANVIELTPLTGASGLIVSDAYAQMDGMIVEFDKPTANASSTVTVNFGQTGGTLLGAKSLKKQDGSNPLIGQVQGRVKIQFDVSSDYWILLPYSSVSVPVGYIETELDISGTNLIVRNPNIEIGGLLVRQSDITIDLTALVASTWYALCCNETTGVISAQNISSVFNTGGGGNWDISGNQLDMYDSIWDNDRKYCRAYDATDYYRVFGVFLTNSTPNDVDAIFYVPNIPYMRIKAYRSTNLSLGSGYNTIVWNAIYYDLNSELNSGTGIITSKINQTAHSGFDVFQLTGAVAGAKKTNFNVTKKVATFQHGQDLYEPAIATTALNLSSVYPIDLIKGETFICRVDPGAAGATLQGNINNNFTAIGTP